MPSRNTYMSRTSKHWSLLIFLIILGFLSSSKICYAQEPAVPSNFKLDLGFNVPTIVSVRNFGLGLVGGVEVNLTPWRVLFAIYTGDGDSNNTYHSYNDYRVMVFRTVRLNTIEWSFGVGLGRYGYEVTRRGIDSTTRHGYVYPLSSELAIPVSDYVTGAIQYHLQISDLRPEHMISLLAKIKIYTFN